MTCILGVDGGGTKTHALVADERGGPRGFGQANPSNHRGWGLDAVMAAVASAGGRHSGGRCQVVRRFRGRTLID